MRRPLSELIEGRLSAPDARSQLIRLATRPTIEETREVETCDALGRGNYERGGDPGNGCRNGIRTERIET